MKRKGGVVWYLSIGTLLPNVWCFSGAWTGCRRLILPCAGVHFRRKHRNFPADFPRKKIKFVHGSGSDLYPSAYQSATIPLRHRFMLHKKNF